MDLIRGGVRSTGVVLVATASAGESALVMNGDADAVVTPLARGTPGTRGERALVRAARRGSEEALEQLFRLHWPRAHRAAFLVVHDRAGAEDIAQEAFLSAIRALDRFDRRRPFGPWLHRIVVNRAIDWVRARALRGEVSSPAEPASNDAPAVAGAGGDRVGFSEEVVAALATLTPEHRAVVVLRYLLDFTPGEVAAALDLPRGTVNSRLRRGLDRLATALQEDR